jgi:hypothetical protein
LDFPMLRRDLLRALMSTPLASWLRTWLPSAIGDAATSCLNAADLYRGAFDWAEGLVPEQSKQLREAATIAIDERWVGAMLKQARPAVKALREAAAIDQFRWGPETVTSEDLGKGHLNVCNLNVIHVACLSARRHAKSGKWRDALDDGFAGLTLAHRIGAGGLLLARILECSGEVTVFQALGRMLPEMDRAALDDLSRRLAMLPPPEPASAVIEPESRFIVGSVRSKLVTLGPVIEGDEWAELGFDEQDSAVLNQLTGGDRSKLLEHLNATAPAFAELASRLDLPRPDCRAALDEFAKAEHSIHPIAAGLVENAWGVRHMVDRMRALRSMLTAGVALIRDGEAAFRAEADPFGMGAFGLERRGKGYVIRSALRDEGKPEFSLKIGDAA